MKNKLSNPQHEADFIARYGQIPTDQWPTSRDGMEWKLKREGYLAGREDGEKELASMSATEACAAIPAMFEWAEGKEKELSIASAATEQMEAGLYEASEEFKDQLAEKDAIIAQLREALELRKVWTSREIHQAHVVPRIEQAIALPTDHSALDAALAKERERCAKFIDSVSDDWASAGDNTKADAADYLSGRVRALGKEES